MTTIQYLSYSKPKRALLKTGHFFKSIPSKIWIFLKKIPYFFGKLFKKMAIPFICLYEALLYGDWKTKLTFLVSGFGEVTRKQYIRGILHFVFEVLFIIYMALFGGGYLSKLGNFGTFASGQLEIPNPPFIAYRYQDDSFMILFYSVISIVIILCFVFSWYSSIAFSKRLQDMLEVGRHTSDKELLKSLTNRNYDKTLLSIPMLGILVFTVIPILIMICIGFTNYNSYHTPPRSLFDWVGTSNFENLFGMKETGASEGYLYIFVTIFLWTLIWAFFATFSNYFLGMIIAIMINAKGIKLKKFWRTILVTTIAVPQFVSLLLLSKMFSEIGFVNRLLESLNIIDKPIQFLNTKYLSNVMIILINMWVGIPYTVLICTGILLNIPADLYESARIDGASPYKMYMKITLPYMLFVTTPYLISQFVGNINNFNVIYLLTNGKPIITEVINDTQAGNTDLLITWLYKLAKNTANIDYGLSSVIGLLIFCIVAFFSLVFYSKTKSVKNEEEFQ